MTGRGRDSDRDKDQCIGYRVSMQQESFRASKREGDMRISDMREGDMRGGDMKESERTCVIV